MKAGSGLELQYFIPKGHRYLKILSLSQPRPLIVLSYIIRGISGFKYSLFSKELESLVGEIAIGAISTAIQEAFTSMSYTVLGILSEELKIVMKDAGVVPCISNLTKIKFIIQQMELGNALQDPKFDRVWEDIKGFDKETPFTVVAMADKGSNFKRFDYVAVIPDSYLERALNNPFLAAYAKSVLSYFTKIGDLESVGSDFPTTANCDCLPFLRSGCKLKSLPDVKVYNVDDYSSKSKSLNANIWVNFWKYFFQNISSTGDLACKLATNCQIHIPYETPSFVTGDLIELANEDQGAKYLVFSPLVLSKREKNILVLLSLYIF